MSVPLDRLYNFLHGICNHDIIIYRFFPHGSKKLDDLTLLYGEEVNYPWLKKMTTPYIIFHDQEPLNFNLYSKEDIASYNQKNYSNKFSGYTSELQDSMHIRCCVAATSNGYDQVLIAHSERNSPEVALYEQNGFINVYYWSHAIIARDWYRFAEIDPTLATPSDPGTTDFLIYNRAWSGSREYRLTFAEMLVDQNLIPCCNITFSELDEQQHYSSHVFKNPELAISRTDLHQHILPNSASAASSADYNNKDYKNTAIDVVLETLFDDPRNHLTEKALRPIACGRPFILAATSGSLAYLRSYGFETFDGLIDESYDTIEDPKLRLTAIAAEMNRISQLAPEAKLALWDQLYAIADRNKKRFFSREFHDFVIQEFKDNFDIAVSRLTTTGKYWREFDRLALTNPALQLARKSDLPHRSLEDVRKFEAWLTLQ